MFLLGNTSWRIRYVRGGEVIVSDAHGAPPTIPFWLGEAPGRTIELSAEVVAACGASERGSGRQRAGTSMAGGTTSTDHAVRSGLESAERMRRRATVGRASRRLRYVAAQQAAVGMVPTGERDRLRAVLRRIGRHAAGDPRAARRADQPGLGPGAAQAVLPQLRFRAAGRGRRRRHRALARPAAQLSDRQPVRHARPAQRRRPAGAGPAGRADVPGPLAVERHAGAGRAAAAGRQEGAAAPAAVPQRGSAGRRVSRNRRLPGEPSRRRRDPRPSARAADDARLPARGDGPRRAGSNCWTTSKRGEIEARRPRHARALAVQPRAAQRQSLRVPRRRAAGRAPHAGRGHAPLAVDRRACRTWPGSTRSDRPGRAEAWPLVRDADELHDALLALGVLPVGGGAGGARGGGARRGRPAAGPRARRCVAGRGLGGGGGYQPRRGRRRADAMARAAPSRCCRRTLGGSTRRGVGGDPARAASRRGPSSGAASCSDGFPRARRRALGRWKARLCCAAVPTARPA